MFGYPVKVRADRTAPPGRWLWLVKWLLLIPHFVVLVFLWTAFVAMTVVAYVAVLVTGRYPTSIHAFNVGVLRWSWRVNVYGYAVLGTDRYPPFTLAEVPDYPAGLDAGPPPTMPRWRPLVAWLFVLPHLLVLAAFAGSSWAATRDGVSGPMGVVAVGLVIAALALLFTGRYPAGLYDLLVGVARWGVRVVAYVALLSDTYPPFRLDQGAREPDLDGPTDQAGATGRPAVPSAGGPAAAPATGGGAGRTVAVVAGVLLLFGALGLGAAGGLSVALGTQRDDGFISSPRAAVVSSTAVVTSETLEMHTDRTILERLGVGDVRLTAVGAGAHFVGVARKTDVDGWLAGTAYDRVTAVAGRSGVRLDRVDGVVRAVGAPEDQSFWLSSAVGAGTVTMNWTMESGTYVVVLANADGAPGIAADIGVAARIPDPTPLGVGLLGGSLIALVAALALIYVGASGLGRGGPPSPTTGPPVVDDPTARPGQADPTPLPGHGAG
ncbi:DUF4389 domain-containing protein [Asanoa sp. NPDC049518]|uniref:DUF4389 domain-containing protein n=1 Tax=unclassified Asanoa TaxID=2685164 RepID=UPI003436FF3F